MRRMWFTQLSHAHRMHSHALTRTRPHPHTSSYLAFGTSMDWVFANTTTARTYTLEVYGGEAEAVYADDPFGFFNPPTPSRLRLVVDRWVRVLMDMVAA